MSKSNGTTRFATFKEWIFEGEEYDGFIETWTADLRADNVHQCVGAVMQGGLRVAGVNSFTNVMPGEKVVLRTTAGRSYDNQDRPRKWVMTGPAN